MHYIRCLRLKDPAAFRFDLAKPVDRMPERINNAAKVPVTNRDGKHFPCPAHLLAFLNTCKFAQDHYADLTRVKVECQPESAVFKSEKLICHTSRQAFYLGNTIAGSFDIADLLGWSCRRRV